MPGPGPKDDRLERLGHDGWGLVEFGTPREMNAAYRALTAQSELRNVLFRVRRPDGRIDVANG